MKVYISGGITGVPNWRDRFEAGAQLMEDLPWVEEIIIPPDIPACSSGDCQPWPGNPKTNGHTWTCWLRHDIAEMVVCDAVATLPGWELSRGAVLEVTTALQLGLKVFAIPDDQLDNKLIEMEMAAQGMNEVELHVVVIDLNGEVDGL